MNKNKKETTWKKENIVDKENKQFEQVKAELELVKKQRDIALKQIS